MFADVCSGRCGDWMEEIRRGVKQVDMLVLV